MSKNAKKQSSQNSAQTFNWTPEEVEKVIIRDLNAAITTFHTILTDKQLLAIITDRLLSNIQRQQEKEESLSVEEDLSIIE